jgi:hypothetical protein
VAAVAESTNPVPVPAISCAPAGGRGSGDVAGALCLPCPSDEVVGFEGGVGGGVGVVAGTGDDGVVSAVCLSCPTRESAGSEGGRDGRGLCVAGGRDGKEVTRVVTLSRPLDGGAAGVVCRPRFGGEVRLSLRGCLVNDSPVSGRSTATRGAPDSPEPLPQMTPVVRSLPKETALIAAPHTSTAT